MDERPVSTAWDEAEREDMEALLRKLGADETLVERARRHMRDADLREVVAKFKAYAQEKPAVVLGALSALVLGGAVAAGRAVQKSASRRSASRSRSTSKKKPAARSAAKKTSSRGAAKRTLIEPHAGDKRYIRRDAKGRIKESVDVGRSLAADRRRHSKKRAKPGQGDHGDR